MKNFIILFAFLLPLVGFSQRINLNTVEPTEDYENIWVKKLSNDKKATSFLIWVKKDVALHKHADHTENVYVLAGTATVVLGDEVIDISPGDFITIPAGTPHSVVVTSRGPLKVISIQAPEFDGTDRIMLETDQ